LESCRDDAIRGSAGITLAQRKEIVDILHGHDVAHLYRGSKTAGAPRVGAERSSSAPSPRHIYPSSACARASPLGLQSTPTWA
jgi:hypothetical protein